MDDQFFLKGLLEEVTSYYSNKCEQKEITIEIDCEPYYEIKTDRRLLASLIQALLDNAIKYTNRMKSIINLSVDLNPQTKYFVFKIIDRGSGINKKDMNFISRMLKNPLSTSNTESCAGLGIGLRTCQAIIGELSGGTGDMSISSLLGSGTTISFELPQSVKSGNSIGKRESSIFDDEDLSHQQAESQLKEEYQKDRQIKHGQTFQDGSNSPKILAQNNGGMHFIDAIAQAMAKKSNLDINIIRIHQASRTQPPTHHSKMFSMFKKRLSSTILEKISSIILPNEARRVMIVDDEVFLLEYLRDLLEDFKIEVYSASTPEKAIKIADMLTQLKRKIHMVYIDFNMPSMNGAQCTKVLKSEKYRSTLGAATFIALTAQNDAMVKGKFKEVGVTKFIFKPYTYDQIKESLVSSGLIHPHIEPHHIS